MAAMQAVLRTWKRPRGDRASGWTAMNELPWRGRGLCSSASAALPQLRRGVPGAAATGTGAAGLFLRGGPRPGHGHRPLHAGPGGRDRSLARGPSPEHVLLPGTRGFDGVDRYAAASRRAGHPRPGGLAGQAGRAVRHRALGKHAGEGATGVDPERIREELEALCREGTFWSDGRRFLCLAVSFTTWLESRRSSRLEQGVDRMLAAPAAQLSPSTAAS